MMKLLLNQLKDTMNNKFRIFGGVLFVSLFFLSSFSGVAQISSGLSFSGGNTKKPIATLPTTPKPKPIIDAILYPSVSAVSEAVVREGEFLRIELTIGLRSSDPIKVSASNMPEGARFDKNNYVFEWTPEWNQSGEYEVTFKAENEHGYDTHTSRILVRNVPTVHMEIPEIEVETILNWNVNLMRYELSPVLVNLGDLQLSDPDVRLLQDDSIHLGNIYGMASYRLNQDGSYSIRRDIILERHALDIRHSATLKFEVTGVDGNGNAYRQIVEVPFALGRKDADMGGLNKEALVVESTLAGRIDSIVVKGNNLYVADTYDAEYHAFGSEFVGYGELNDDGEGDYLFFNVQSGDNEFAFDNWVGHTAGSPWVQTLLGVGDFDGDHMDEFFVLDARNNAVGKTDWRTLSLENGDYPRWPVDWNLEVLYVADFDGDGREDVLWRDTFHQELVFWNHGDGSAENVEVFGHYDDFDQHIIGYGDCDGNGTNDIVYMQTDQAGVSTLFAYCRVQGIWEHRELFHWNEGSRIFKASGDFDGNGKLDFLFQIGSSLNHYSTVSMTIGGAREQPVLAWWTPGPQIEAVRDIDGNGTDDVIWVTREENGPNMEIDVWLMEDLQHYSVVSAQIWEGKVF